MTGPRTGKVWVDGIELTDVVAVRFGVDVSKHRDGYGCLEVVQRFYKEIEIEGEMDVTVLDNNGSRTFSDGMGP